MLLPEPWTPAIEAVLQTAPRAARNALTAAWVQRNGPIRLVVRIVDQKSSVRASRSANGMGAGVFGVPALLTRKSSRPSAAIASPTMRSAAPGRADDAPPLALQPLDRRRPARIVGQIVECHRRSAARKMFRRGKPDARGRTGD